MAYYNHYNNYIDKYQDVKKIQERCKNCNYLYFINLKIFKEPFCSLDCKSTYNYIHTIIQPKIDKIFNSSINFSDCSFADELNNSDIYKSINIQSMPELYIEQKNHKIYNSL